MLCPLSPERHDDAASPGQHGRILAVPLVQQADSEEGEAMRWIPAIIWYAAILLGFLWIAGAFE